MSYGASVSHITLVIPLEPILTGLRLAPNMVIDVTGSDTDAANADFADFSYIAEPWSVRDINLNVLNWPADRHIRLSQRRRHGNQMMRHAVGALGRPVMIENGNARIQGKPRTRQSRR